VTDSAVENAWVTLLASIPEPTGTAYATELVKEYPGYRLGRGQEGSVVLLTPPDQDPEPPTRLRVLSLDPRIRCRVTDMNGMTHELDHGVVELRPDDPAVIPAFLAVARAVARIIGDNPAPGQVSRGMQRLVAMFETGFQARGSAVGLWGELFVIAHSHNPLQVAESWHATVDARFDFSDSGTRVDAKTTTRQARVHTFNLSQLQTVPGATSYIASVMTTETDLGTPISALVAEIESHLTSRPDLQMRIHELVAQTLGADWVTQADRRFDRDQAAASYSLLPAAQIPRVDDPPPEVTEVHLTVDCTDVPVAATTSGLAGLLAA
jgi:hypothetical protein